MAGRRPFNHGGDTGDRGRHWVKGGTRATAADAEARSVDGCEQGGPGGPGETATRAAYGDDTATER